MSNNPFGPSTSASNNPFLEDPSSSAHTRFPALSTSPPPQQFTPSPLGYAPQQTGFGGSGFFSQPQLPLQPTGFFPAVQSPYGTPMSPGGFGAPAYTPQFQPAPPGPMSQAALPTQLREFDPYTPSSLGAPQQSQYGQAPSPYAQSPYAQSPQPYAAPAQTRPSTSGRRPEDHPREWIRAHKAELEIWDPVSWNQALAAFDALAHEWELRKTDADMRVRAAAQGMMAPQDAAMWQNMLREANENLDKIAASKYQMQEVLNGYRQSTDPASKRRVREGMNAGLIALPDWP